MKKVLLVVLICVMVSGCTNQTCKDDCDVPQSYKARSICAYEAECIQGECEIFCPVQSECSADSDCDCASYRAADMEDCKCFKGECAAVVDYKCAGEGNYTSGPVSPEYQYGCCDGLEGFDSKGHLVGAGVLCYDPAKGKPVCREDGWHYPNGELLREEECK